MTHHRADRKFAFVGTNQFARGSHEFGLRFSTNLHPARVVIFQIVRIEFEFLFEIFDERFFVAAIRDAVGIGLRIVAHIAGANPIEENSIEIVGEQFLEQP